MANIAFEVTLNGEHQYTVGADRWNTLWVQVLGHHIDPERLRASASEQIPDLPSEPFNHLRLHSSVSVSGEDIQVTTPDGRVHTTSKSGSYPAHDLSPGDVIQIRVVETDSPDDPDWAEYDPRFPGQTVILQKGDSK